ncbi:MAG: pantetheine-phosphate adenylyltransferase [Nanoarchaeota archaeon]|nr:pantetheine-phosphate adenylyltransferase [Nanoarchaeota archaeon]
MKKYKKIAVYAGSFDPVTNGHIDILERSKKIFDKVICTIGVNSEKNTLFTLEERLDMLYNTVPEGVEVSQFEGLLVDYAKKVKEEKKAEQIVLVRGLRITTDFEYEYRIFFNNTKLDESIDTIFLPSKQELLHINSSIVRDVSKMNPGYIKTLDVPDYVKQKLKEKYR